MKPVIIIGSGIGGLSAAIRLARKGVPVHILEARTAPGGLASGLELDGFSFDAGPYILLDKPGLDGALKLLGIPPEGLPLIPIEDVYSVLDNAGTTTSFYRDLEKTARGMEAQYPSSGEAYKRFVQKTFRTHQHLQSLTFKSRPGPLDIIRKGLFAEVPFLLSSLYRVLESTGLPVPVKRAISIWTHIAGQDTREAPAAMAFVPGLFHNIGSFYPKGGMRALAALLTTTAEKLGVKFSFGQKVSSVQTSGRAVTGVQLSDGGLIAADHIISNAGGIGTYTGLVEAFPEEKKKALQSLPLQSPGMCIYLAVKGRHMPHYIRFLLKEKSCIAFVQPGVPDESAGQDGWYPARLIAPLGHAAAEALGIDGQQKLMDELLRESWWQEGIGSFRVLHKRTTFEWGSEYNLYRDSMNPVMTARFMLKGRMPHRSKDIRGLYLAGSSTHPGQWVSFCAISGILAADALCKDAGIHA